MPATKTTPRRRASKSTTLNSKVVAKESITKYSQTNEIKPVTETPTPESPQPESTSSTRRFATTRPAEPKISLEEYISDFKVRMQINNYEVMEFWEDCVRFYKSAQPVVVKFADYVKDSYNRAFNQETKEEK